MKQEKVVNLIENVYTLYNSGGWECWTGFHFSQLISLLFTIWFSTWLFIGINWSVLLQCNSELECIDISILRFNQVWNQPTIWDIIILVYFFVFHLYWIWNLWFFIIIVKRARSTKTFYEERLRIISCSFLEFSSFDKDKLDENHNFILVHLDLISWDIINQRLLALPEIQSAGFRCEEDIRSCIQYKENQWISLFQEDELEIFTTKTNSLSCSSFWTWNIIGIVLEWNLRFLLLKDYEKDNISNSNSNPNTNLKIKEVQKIMAKKLQHRFRILALLNLIILPFLFVFTLIYFILRHAEEVQNKQQTFVLFANRYWSNIAKILFRKRNELPHEFYQRLKYEIQPLMDQYVQIPRTTWFNIIAQLIAYISGAIVAILIALTLIDSSLLLHNFIVSSSLFYHLAFFSTLLAISRSFSPNDDSNTSNISLPVIRNNLFKSIITATQYPLLNNNTNNSSFSYQDLYKFEKELSFMYRTRFQMLFTELFSLLCVPYILGIYYTDLEKLTRIIEITNNSFLNLKQKEMKKIAINNISHSLNESTHLKTALRELSRSNYNHHHIHSNKYSNLETSTTSLTSSSSSPLSSPLHSPSSSLLSSNLRPLAQRETKIIPKTKYLTESTLLLISGDFSSYDNDNDDNKNNNQKEEEKQEI